MRDEVCEVRDFDREVEKIYSLISRLEDRLNPVLVYDNETGSKGLDTPKMPKSPAMQTMENIQYSLERIINRVNI